MRVSGSNELGTTFKYVQLLVRIKHLNHFNLVESNPNPPALAAVMQYCTSTARWAPPTTTTSNILAPIRPPLPPGKLVGNQIRCSNCEATIRTSLELDELGDHPWWQVQCAKAQFWTKGITTGNWRCPACSAPCVQQAAPDHGCIPRHGNHHHIEERQSFTI